MILQDIKNNYKNIDWLKKNAQMIHYFGLGFIQLKLALKEDISIYRLHFYTEKLPPIIGDEDIHDHRYPFISHILKGKFSQTLFQLIDGDSYILEYESCKEGTEPEFIRKCNFDAIYISTYTAGSVYGLNHDTFHKVETEEAITLLCRPERYEVERARVGRLVDSPKVCPFSKKIEEKELWDIVASMLED